MEEEAGAEGDRRGTGVGEEGRGGERRERGGGKEGESVMPTHT